MFIFDGSKRENNYHISCSSKQTSIVSYSCPFFVLPKLLLFRIVSQKEKKVGNSKTEQYNKNAYLSKMFIMATVF